MKERGQWNLGCPPFRVRVALAFCRWCRPGDDGLGLAVITSDRSEHVIMIITIELSDSVLEPCEKLLSGRLVESREGIVVVDEDGAESDWPAQAVPGWPAMPGCVAIERAAQLARALAAGQ